MSMNHTPTQSSRWRSPIAIGAVLVIVAIILIALLLSSGGGGGMGGY
jgi:hypothetical protein